MPFPSIEGLLKHEFLPERRLPWTWTRWLWRSSRPDRRTRWSCKEAKTQKEVLTYLTHTLTRLTLTYLTLMYLSYYYLSYSYLSYSYVFILLLLVLLLCTYLTLTCLTLMYKKRSLNLSITFFNYLSYLKPNLSYMELDLSNLQHLTYRTWNIIYLNLNLT